MSTVNTANPAPDATARRKAECASRGLPLFPLELALRLLDRCDANNDELRKVIGEGFLEEYGAEGRGHWTAWAFGACADKDALRAEWDSFAVSLANRSNNDVPAIQRALIRARNARSLDGDSELLGWWYADTEEKRRQRAQDDRNWKQWWEPELLAGRKGARVLDLREARKEVQPAETLTPPPAAARPPVADFPYADAHEFVKGPPMSWLVKGVIPKAELGMIYGASGSGKSFFAGDLAVHLAAGLEWRGRRTKKVRVAYIAAEGAVGFKSRLRATATHLGVKLADLQLGVFNCAPNFTDDAQAAKLKEQLAALKPDVVFVDTLARVAAGADENSGKDMGKVLDHCKAIQQAAGALVIIIHHSGKNAALGARGWSGIKAACDVEIEVSRAGPTARLAALSKQKDGADGEDFGFQLVPVEVVDEAGQPVKDEDGEQVYSCYVAPVAEEAMPKPPATARKLGPVETLVMQAAVELCGLVGHTDEALVTERVASRMPRGKAKRDQRKRRAEEALTSLAADELIAIQDGKVSVC